MNKFFCLTWRNPSEKFFCYPSSSLPSLLPSSPVLSTLYNPLLPIHTLSWSGCFLEYFFLLQVMREEDWNCPEFNSGTIPSDFSHYIKSIGTKISKFRSLRHSNTNLFALSPYSLFSLHFCLPFVTYFHFVALHHHYFYHYSIVTVCFISFSPCYYSYFCIVKIKILLKMQNFVFSSNPRIATFVMIYFSLSSCIISIFSFRSMVRDAHAYECSWVSSFAYECSWESSFACASLEEFRFSIFIQIPLSSFFYSFFSAHNSIIYLWPSLFFQDWIRDLPNRFPFVCPPFLHFSITFLRGVESWKKRKDAVELFWVQFFFPSTDSSPQFSSRRLSPLFWIHVWKANLCFCALDLFSSWV